MVWHIHGSTDLNESRSRLVITDEDYARLYLDGSRVLTQLTGLLANTRAVIIGFGFRDQEIMRALKVIGRLTDATRPIFALVEKHGEFKHTIDRQVFLRQYHVDVQPYRNEDGRHQNLGHILKTYKSLSLRRSLRYGKQLTAPPDYDPETTGLLIYNDLVLRTPVEIPKELRSSILRSRVLAACERQPKKIVSIRTDLVQILEALAVRVGAPTSDDQLDEALGAAIGELISDGLLVRNGDMYSLSDAGQEVVLDHSAVANRNEDQFVASLKTRLDVYLAPASHAVDRPLKVLRSFFRKAIERRALGVALAFATGGGQGQQEYHALALLQSIADWLDRADDEVEAYAVIQTIQDIFREPSVAESTYISTSVQARFVLHLLSLDNDTLAVRMRELAKSLFLIDSSTLIPWLADGSSGHVAAEKLLAGLRAAGATIATTLPLAEEVAEHVRWATNLVRDANGIQSELVLEAATGRAGIKTNAFLEGYLSLSGSGASAESFEAYISRCLGGVESKVTVTDAILLGALQRRSIRILDFDTLSKAPARLMAKARDYQRIIEERRRASASFKHERQVRAEAEAVVIIESARSGELGEGFESIANAYFVSNTSMLNRLNPDASSITMRPEATLSWLATLRPLSSEDIQALMSELLWELQERRMNLVNQADLLSAFGPIISASRERLEALLPQYQALMSERYGGGAKVHVPDLDAPVVLASLLEDRVVQLEGVVAELEGELARSSADLKATEERAHLTEEERGELSRVRRKDRRRAKYERRMNRLRGTNGREQRQKGKDGRDGRDQ